MIDSIPIQVFSIAKRGKRWPHKHEWVPLKEHPRGGEVSFCFWLDSDEAAMVEMCWTCLARRMKGIKIPARKKASAGDIALYVAIGLVCSCIFGLIAAAIYSFGCLGSL